MRRLFLTVLFVLIAVPAGAVSTTSLQLTTTWQSLGSGPLQVQTNNQSQTLYQISDSAPAAGAGGFFLQGNSAPQVIQTTSQVWVRVRNAGSGPVPVVLYAPVTMGSSTSSSTITQPVGSNTKAQSVSVTYATDQLLPAFAATPTFNLASGTGVAAYGPTPIGTAPGQPPLFLGYADASGLTRGVTPATELPSHDYDVRGSGSLSAAANQTFTIPINGQGTIGLRFSGLTASGATLSFTTSNDGGTTYSQKNTINCATGVGPSTLTTDSQLRIDVAGATNLQVAVTTGGSGTISYAYNLSAAPVSCPNGPIPPGTNAIGTVNAVQIPNSTTGSVTAVTVGTSSAQAAAAQTRKFLALDNESATASIACSFGGTAALNTAGSFTIPAQNTRTWSGTYVPADAVNCVASVASAPLTLEQN